MTFHVDLTFYAVHIQGKFNTTGSGEIEDGASITWTIRPGNPGHGTLSPCFEEAFMSSLCFGVINVAEHF